MTERKARCASYGRMPGLNGSWDCAGVRNKRPCDCERESIPSRLPFFEPRPAEPFDVFVCGCVVGWD